MYKTPEGMAWLIVLVPLMAICGYVLLRGFRNKLYGVGFLLVVLALGALVGWLSLRIVPCCP